MRARAWQMMLLTEGKLVLRDPAGVVLPLALPLIILTMYGIGPGARDALPGASGLTVVDIVGMPIGILMILAILGLVNVPSFLAAYRQHGTLRRLAVTPAHPAMVLASQVAANLILAAVGIALAIAVAATAFGLSGPQALAWAVACVVFATAALYALGLVVAAVAPSANSAMAIGLVLFLGSVAIGGGMIPAENLPAPVVAIGQVTPFGAGLQSLRDSWVGEVPEVRHLAVMAGWTAASLLAAIKLFRWE